MSYIDQSRRPSPASMAAVVAIHAAVGAALVLGLTVSGVIKTEDGPIISITPHIPPPPPPPEKPVKQGKPDKTPTVFHAPTPPLKLDPVEPTVTTVPYIPVPLPVPQPGLGKAPVVPTPTPRPSFDPVSARARNDPSSWLSDRDYRPGWARRELTGLAKFRLDISAEGRVTACRIVGTTGHTELDEATCTLVSKRARFEPARGGNGEPVAGSYTGSVMWQLPE